jgi:hypothetical protein
VPLYVLDDPGVLLSLHSVNDASRPHEGDPFLAVCDSCTVNLLQLRITLRWNESLIMHQRVRRVHDGSCGVRPDSLRERIVSLQEDFVGHCVFHELCFRAYAL